MPVGGDAICARTFAPGFVERDDFLSERPSVLIRVIEARGQLQHRIRQHALPLNIDLHHAQVGFVCLPVEKRCACAIAKTQPILMHRHQATFNRIAGVPCLHRALEASLIEAIEPAASGTATE
ncbi:hypothetical protein QCE62_10215 [Caballeronia sp. LZ033]|uniref:hypothetical protein n=1 Tax=Caballeronia sp. LZ033 TaxID=3038566 RepID=UPI002858AA47|nr:hypothetical protein [Caballeronia sp. LZ033]MDR5813962.1 hypothetical protein [Caballeronia sp. LZ033]